ncbi:MAG: methionyl-tRNA synthetase [Candidatus Parcubacteria bacterium]|jgi:methionyl-tRNA synthetase|nr:methionyl-tRNA synthetase [Candidatus Parcubacteria bacterium]
MAKYFTTTLPYVNADPHLGTALEFVEADVLARAARLRGEEVFFNTGTDEHGTKILQKAQETGKDPQAYVDEYAARFKAFVDRLNISYSAFTRTTSPGHKAAAQAFWKRCEQAGDIYKAMYEVKYCIGCELEKTDSELDNGRCVIHPHLEIQLIKEENYYFRFSKYQEPLLKLYAARPDFVVPDVRMNEIRSFVERGLKDFSISRRKEKLPWGVPVPGDDEHVMYVWFDALVNYISVINWPREEGGFQKWWPGIQLAGKDNLRQQSAMWQAMLMSAGVAPSRQIFIHGFINSGGQKMSKSLGNVIDPVALADTYGVDAVRYLVLRHVHPFEDSDVTEEGLREAYTANLVNGLGNLVARVMKLAEEHLPGPVVLTDEDMSVEDAFFKKVEAYRFNEAMDLIFEHIGKGDEYMTSTEPYKKIKDQSTKAEALADIEKLVRHLAKVAAHLAPAMPATSEAILTTVRENKKPENLFPRLD